MGEENLVQNWVNTDKQLYNALVEIQNNASDEKKQAQLAFLEIPKMYNLPLFPEDIEDDQFIHSIYEQLSFFNFLEPKGDIRGHVLSSIFNVKEGYLVDMRMVYQKKFGSQEPPKNLLGIGYKGDNINVQPIFVNKGQSWVDLGCRYFTKKVYKL